MSSLRAASYERSCPFFLASANSLFTAPGRANRSRQRGTRVAISSEAGLLEGFLRRYRAGSRPGRSGVSMDKSQ
jgi:hypothetical protein